MPRLNPPAAHLPAMLGTNAINLFRGAQGEEIQSLDLGINDRIMFVHVCSILSLIMRFGFPLLGTGFRLECDLGDIIAETVTVICSGIQSAGLQIEGCHPSWTSKLHVSMCLQVSNPCFNSQVSNWRICIEVSTWCAQQPQFPTEERCPWTDGLSTFHALKILNLSFYDAWIRLQSKKVC